MTDQRMLIERSAMKLVNQRLLLLLVLEVMTDDSFKGDFFSNSECYVTDTHISQICNNYHS